MSTQRSAEQDWEVDYGVRVCEDSGTDAAYEVSKATRRTALARYRRQGGQASAYGGAHHRRMKRNGL